MEFSLFPNPDKINPCLGIYLNERSRVFEMALKIGRQNTISDMMRLKDGFTIKAQDCFVLHRSSIVNV